MKVLILSVAVLAVFNFAWAMVAEDPAAHSTCGSEEEEEFTCMGETLVKSPAFDKAKDECLQEKIDAIKADKKDRQKGMTCLAICEWQKLGVMDKNGKFNEAKSEELLKSFNFSAPLTKKIKEATDECYKKYMSKLVWDPKDKNCSSYREIVKCEFDTFMKVCDEKYDAEDWAF